MTGGIRERRCVESGPSINSVFTYERINVYKIAFVIPHYVERNEVRAKKP